VGGGTNAAVVLSRDYGVTRVVRYDYTDYTVIDYHPSYAIKGPLENITARARGNVPSTIVFPVNTDEKRYIHAPHGNRVSYADVRQGPRAFTRE